MSILFNAALSKQLSKWFSSDPAPALSDVAQRKIWEGRNNSAQNAAQILSNSKIDAGRLTSDAAKRLSGPSTYTAYSGIHKTEDSRVKANPPIEQPEPTSKLKAAQPTVNIAPEQVLEFTPRPNILSEYSTSSYTVSIHILSNEQASDNWFLSNSIPANQQIIKTGGLGHNDRNKFFDVDFFIDDIEITSLIGTKAGGRVTNATDIRFKIHEPYGLSFVERLSHAVNDITGNPNYPTQPYLMTLQFYGYDDDGKVVNSGVPISVKKIPFIFSNVTFRVAGKGVEYACEAYPWNQLATTAAHATIHHETEIVANTVEQFFNSGTTKTPGLAEQLNKEQVNIAKEHGIVPDEYEFIVATSNAGNSIGKGTLKKPGDAIKKQTSMSNATNANPNAEAPSKHIINTNARTTAIKAGQNIIELIEQVVRNSSFITDQARIQFNQNPNAAEKRTNQRPPGVLQWFRVLPTVSIIKYDKKRNANAHKFTYVIEPYTVHDVNTPEFTATKLKGVHKQYDYWFTGENSEILSFEQEYNYAYYTTFGSTSGTADVIEKNSKAAKTFTAQAQAQYAVNPNESTQSAETQSVKLAAQAASTLYSISDIARIEMKILGDPAWLQAELFAPTGKPSVLTAFTEDGSINGNVGEVMLNIKYNIPTDYDLDTGLQNPLANNNNTVGNSDQLFNRTFSQNYLASQVIHKFSDGLFTQQLSGFLSPAAMMNEKVAEINNNITPVVVSKRKATNDVVAENTGRVQQDGTRNK